MTFIAVRTHDNHCVDGIKFEVRLSMTKEEMKNKRKEESRGMVEVNEETIKKRYFKPNMMTDPWKHCKPVQVLKTGEIGDLSVHFDLTFNLTLTSRMTLNDLKIEKNRQRRDQNIRHRNRLFMRASETASPPSPNPNSSQPKPELGKIVAGQGQNHQPKNEQIKTAKTEPGQESHCQNETKEKFFFKWLNF